MTAPRDPGQEAVATTGGTPAGRRWLVLTGALTVATVVAVAVGAMAAEPPAGSWVRSLIRLAVAAGVIAVAQLGRLQLRVGGGVLHVAWGEAALIIALYVVPPGWLPAVTLVGVAVAWTVLSIGGDRRPPLDILRIAVSLTVAAALGAAATAALAEPLGSSPSPTSAAALTLGAMVYLVVAVVLAVLTMSVRLDTRFWPLLVPTLRGKLLMFVGNVLVGLVVVTLIDLEPRWLLLLPPALWFLQQTYSHRLRADDERRIWRTFADVTGALNQLDEHSVATAGVAGALALFGAERVDVDVIRPDGRWRRYQADTDGLVTDRDIPPQPAPDAAPRRPVRRADPGDEFEDGFARLAGAAADRATDSDQELTRSLVVGSVRVGELRVRFPRAVPPGPRDHAALSAFGDALGAALHDAATHRELRVVTARSSYDAVHDPLTGLVNRTAMLGRGDALLRGLDHGQPVALLLLDINNFKEVNDTLGHAAGDELLQLIAVRLGTRTGPDELLGRLGGDEFALLVTVAQPPAAGREDRPAGMPYAVRRAREIVELLTAPMEIAGVRMSIEASVGVVVAGAGTADMTELLRRADIAMYQAKQGGGSVASYDSARDAASTDQLAVLAELREALEVSDQLVLALQPAVDLASGAPTGVEALIRWNHPRRGWLGPTDFVRTIEDSELLGVFTRYVLDQALTVAAEWARHGLDVPISINLSARSLLDPRLPAEIAESLRRHRVPPHRLVLEITETVVMSDLEVIDEVLAALRSLGVQLAVDDFGTGFSSLAFLTRISVDELKVDRSFVIRMAESPEAAAIVRATVELARELGLRVVAEGVETADQRAALAQLGCTAAQGYHFFKPMPSDKIVAVLRSLLDSAQARIYPLRADGAS